MKKILILLIVGCIASDLAAQTECTQKLRTARVTYEQGRLHELPPLLEACLVSGFSQSERIEAYKLLIQTYIYLEEPDKADASMIALLNTDHFFQVNQAVDPVEFKSLYSKFRTDPVYRWGGRVGININHVRVLKNHFMWASSQGKGVYQPNPGVQFGLFFEKDLRFANKKLDKKLTANPEVFFNSYSFTYLNDNPLATDVQSEGKLEHVIAQNHLQANLLMQYKLEDEIKLADKFTPYIAIGPTIAYLNKSSFDGNTNVGAEITGSAFDTKFNYQQINIALTASAGFKLKVGEVYLTADVRVQYGLHNLVNPDNRFKWTEETEEQLYYGYVDNDFIVSQSMLNIGIVVPHFHPIKLIR